jgi:predicted amidophosphoribosyltransferase
VVRDLITGMKYGPHANVASWCAELADEVRDECGEVDVITWAPTSSRRRHERGFDQAELIARHVARRWAVPVRRLLTRHGGGHQTGRSRLERLAAPSFRARSPQGRPSIVVIDDVVTTGGTLYAARTALLDAGAGRVTALAIAATPPPAVIGTDHRPVRERPGR